MALSVGMMGQPASAQDEAHLYSIPSENLDAALRDFGMKSGKDVVFDGSLVQGKRSPKIEGQLSDGVALQRLLSGSGLNFTRTTSGGFVVIAGEIKNAQAGPSEGPASQMAENAAVQQTETVQVTGYRASLEKSLDIKRKSANVVDAIVAKDIGDFPDLNISESLSRITGVTIQRVAGEGNQVSVRGLAPEFTRVTINGQTVTSGNAGREVNFNIFASELFSQVQVQKSPSASHVEGGLASTIDMRIARPFDFKEDREAVSIQGLYNDNRGRFDPRVFGLASTRLLNGTLGVLVSAAFSQQSLRDDDVEANRWLLKTFTVNGTAYKNVEIPGLPRYSYEPHDEQRLGVTGALQYQPTDNLELNVDLAFSRFHQNFKRYISDANMLSVTTATAITVDSTNRVVSGTFPNIVNDHYSVEDPSTEELLLANLDAAWTFADHWKASGKLSYSESNKYFNDFELIFQGKPTSFSYDFSDPIFPAMNFANLNVSDSSKLFYGSTVYADQFTRDEESSGQADIQYNNPGSFFSAFKLGARLADRNKRYNQFNGQLNGNGTLALSAAPYASSIPVNDFFSNYSSPNIPRSYAVVTDFDAAKADPAIGLAAVQKVVTQNKPASFLVAEQTASGYGEVDFDDPDFVLPIRGNAGVRVSATNQTSKGVQVVNGTPSPVSIPNDYVDVLPSANVAANITDDLVLRGAAYRGMARATLSQLSPQQVYQTGSLTLVEGNPTLAPFRATQFDAGLEWYFGEQSLLSAMLFYKDVESFIVSVTSNQVVNNPSIFDINGNSLNGKTFLVTQPINGKGATVKGAEIEYQQPFTFLPAPFDGLGVQANATYSESQATIAFNGVSQTTLLPGQSKYSYNLIGFYEKGPYSVRLAYGWRGKYLIQVEANGRRNDFVNAYGSLDTSFKYAITDHLAATFDAINLTNAKSFQFAELTNRQEQFRSSGRFFSAGLKLELGE